jgi:membrane protease YdiL (CAAX protease family)
MNINKDEAALSLAAIEAAGARSTQLQRYRRFAPFLILWGSIWLLANSVSDLAPAQSGTVWLVLTLLGAAASCWIAWRQHAAVDEGSSPRRRLDQSWRWILCFLVIIAFQVTAIAVLPPSDDRQQDTFFSMFWTFLYMAVGAWAGWRLFTIGLAATLLILFGYYGVHSHYFLYMGCVSGGALMAGGLWLRRL